jgi:hypothetical protein
VTTADERLDDGADAIERWADATAPQPPTQTKTHNFRHEPLTRQVLWWVHNHANRDLTVDEIWNEVNEMRRSEGVQSISRMQIVQALYTIRQRPSNALHLELGGHQRRGHVRWWTDPTRRPTPDRKWRPPIAADRRKRVKDLKQQRQLDVPTPTRAETKPPEPTPEYVELGALTDGRVLLTANGDLYLATRYRPGMP